MAAEHEFHRMELRYEDGGGQLWECPKCQRVITNEGGSIKVHFPGNTRIHHVRDGRESFRIRWAEEKDLAGLPHREPMVDRGEHSEVESWGFGVEKDREWLDALGIVW